MTNHLNGKFNIHKKQLQRLWNKDHDPKQVAYYRGNCLGEALRGSTDKLLVDRIGRTE